MTNLSIVAENYRLTIGNAIRNFLAKLDNFVTNRRYTLNTYNLPEPLEFRVTYNIFDKSYFVECLTLPNIYASARNIPSLIKNFNEAIYEIYDIPRAAVLKLGIQYKFRQEFIEKLEEMASKSYNAKARNRIITAKAYRGRLAIA